jgi:hypothetical protein
MYMKKKSKNFGIWLFHKYKIKDPGKNMEIIKHPADQLT